MTVGAIHAGVGIALGTIREHKLRAFLTVLGVIIGTGAVIGVGSDHCGSGWRDHQYSAELRPNHPDRVQVGRRVHFGGLSPEERAASR